jgi:hypothetical protein
MRSFVSGAWCSSSSEATRKESDDVICPPIASLETWVFSAPLYARESRVLGLHRTPFWPSACHTDHRTKSLEAKTTIGATPAPRLGSWDRAMYLRQRAVHSSGVERNGSSSSSLRRPNGKCHLRLPPLISESSKKKVTQGTRLRKDKRQTHLLMILCKGVPAAFMCDPYQ